MSKNKIELPTFEQAQESICNDKHNPLDILIYICEPDIEENRAEFRQCLEEAIQYIIENVDTFGLTTDAPDTDATEALIKDIMDYVDTHYVDSNMGNTRLTRFLRERLRG